MGPIFTIDNGQSSSINKMVGDDSNTWLQTPQNEGAVPKYMQDIMEQEKLARLNNQNSSESQIVTNEYTRPLFQIYGFGVSQMYIHLTSVILMSILVLISLVSGFKK